MSVFKATMHQSRFRLGLCLRPRWGSLQRSPQTPLLYLRGLLLRGGREKEGNRKGKEREGEGKGSERDSRPSKMRNPGNATVQCWLKRVAGLFLLTTVRMSSDLADRSRNVDIGAEVRRHDDSAIAVQCFLQQITARSTNHMSDEQRK